MDLFRRARWFILYSPLFYLSATATITQAWGDNFPCEIPVSASNPRLFLIGEDHSEKEAEDKKRIHLHQAIEGKCYVGLESFFVSDEPLKNLPDIMKVTNPSIESRVYGFDAPFPHGLSTIVHTHQVLEDSVPETLKTSFKYELIDELVANPHLAECFEKYKTWLKGRQTGPKALVARIEDIAGSTHPKALLLQYKLQPGRFPALNDNSEFKVFLKGMGRFYVNMAKSSKYKTVMKTPPDISLATESLEAPSSDAKVKFVDKISVGWRNIFLAANIGKLYCMALNENKDLRIIIGKNHLKGLKEILKPEVVNRVEIVIAEDGLLDSARSLNHQSD
jgi:hypothetical protein